MPISNFYVSKRNGPNARPETGFHKFLLPVQGTLQKNTKITAFPSAPVMASLLPPEQPAPALWASQLRFLYCTRLWEQGLLVAIPLPSGQL